MRENIKLITIDGDGSLFSYLNVGSSFHSSWDALGFAYNLTSVWNERAKKFYKPGEDDYEWAKQDVAELAGRKVEDSFKILYPIPYCAGSREFAKATKGKFLRGVLSSAIDLVVEKAESELDLDFAICNILHYNSGYFSGTHEHRVPLWKKHERIEQICNKYSIQAEQIAHIGDNENDLSVAEKVGLFIALNPKKDSVKKAADFIVNDFFEIMRVFGVK